MAQMVIYNIDLDVQFNSCPVSVKVEDCSFQTETGQCRYYTGILKCDNNYVVDPYY